MRRTAPPLTVDRAAMLKDTENDQSAWGQC